MRSFDRVPTSIGSLPFRDAAEACALVLDLFPEIPAWPQLPAAGFEESMYAQFCDGMPLLRFDTSGDIFAELEPFYARVLDGDVGHFAVPRERASGLYALIEGIAERRPAGLRGIKGQVTGPLSFGLLVTDENRRPILYHEEVHDAVVKTLALKARWQTERLREAAAAAGAPADAATIVFVDEPYLASFGSAYITLDRNRAIASLDEVFDAIHGAGGLAGVHCCGNTDWSMLMATRVDILNFDAYGYLPGMTLYPAELTAFLGRGGALAWGIVPCSAAAEEATAADLARRFREGVDALARKGADRERLLAAAIVTPACGVGSLSDALARRVLHLCRETADLLRS